VIVQQTFNKSTMFSLNMQENH